MIQKTVDIFSHHGHRREAFACSGLQAIAIARVCRARERERQRETEGESVWKVCVRARALIMRA